jgi:protein TonB
MTAPALILQGADAREELRRWSLAAAIVVTAHLGLMAGYVLMPAAEPDGSAESPVVLVELAPVSAAPASPNDMAPGIETPETQPTPKPPEQVEPQVVEPMPRIEAPAEVTLPLPEPKAVEKKPEENPDKQKSETTPVEENPQVQQMTAPPRSDQNAAVTPQAPRPGRDASRDATLTWKTLVAAQLQRYKRYPAGAEARRLQGVVLLTFIVERDGRVRSKSISRSSGYPVLDEQALLMVQLAQPLPAFLREMTLQEMHITLPVRFKAP